MTYRWTLLVVSTVMLVNCDHSDEIPLNQSQQQNVNEINTLISPLTGSDPTLSTSDLQSLDFLSDARIVGMGEATHGSKEFFQMKHRLFQYLVERHGFKAIAFEMDFAEAMMFDDYIQGKRNDDLATLMKTKMLFWVWKTTEVQTLLQWMRAYNSTRAESDRIRFFGIDCQYPTYNADVLVGKIRPIDPSFADDIQSKLADYKKLVVGGDSTNYKSNTKNTNYVYDQVVARKTDLISKGLSATEYEIVKQLARTIVQVKEQKYRVKIADNDVMYRDVYMAENVKWTSDFLGSTAKLCIWAHNLHIGNDLMAKYMGYYINLDFKNSYQKIGFSFSNGKFNAYPNNFDKSNELTAQPLPNSTNFLFKHSKYPQFVLRIDAIPSSYIFSSWTTQYKRMLMVGATYDGNPEEYYIPVILRDSYNVIIYFDATRASEILK